MKFLVKICGVTRPQDAELAVKAGAGAIGINFWRGSKRFVEWSFGHYLRIAPPEFAGERRPAPEPVRAAA